MLTTEGGFSALAYDSGPGRFYQPAFRNIAAAIGLEDGAFLDADLIAIFMTMLMEPLSHEGNERTEQDGIQIEMIITLFRNLLSVRNPDKETRNSAGSHKQHLHEDMIMLFEQEYVLELVVLLTQDIEKKENKGWELVLLEIFDLLFRNQVSRDPVAETQSQLMFLCACFAIFFAVPAETRTR